MNLHDRRMQISNYQTIWGILEGEHKLVFNLTVSLT